MSRQTSGIIINDDIFINSNHVVKMDKSKSSDEEYVINIYLSVATSASPIKLTFNNENDRNVIFNKIVMELYGHDYAHVDF
jgi:hypothetical protein